MAGQGQKTDTEHFLHSLSANQGRIFAYILSLWPNRADAEDILQETITTMWRKLSDYEPGTDFLAWAITVAKYTILSFRKKNRSLHFQFSEELFGTLQKTAGAYFNNLDIHLNALRNCMTKLPEQDKRLLRMRYVQELPVQGIALQFEKSVRAVYKSLSKIHDCLLRCVRRTMAEEGSL